jgi:DNA-binding PadR family transcriptional regulator
VPKNLSRRPRLHGYAIMPAARDKSGEVLNMEDRLRNPALERMEEAGWLNAG